MITEFVIEEWQPGDTPDREIEMLAEILHQVVYAGAGVSFFVPFSMDEAREFWLGSVASMVKAGTRRMLVARQDARIVGTVQLDLATPPNQRHRADVLKLLVHPDAQGRGVAKALMRAAEKLALSEGRTLLTLDTVTGCKAEYLYNSLGFQVCGTIPRYARRSLSADLEGATFMYKELQPPVVVGA